MEPQKNKYWYRMYLCQALCGTVTLPPETGEDQEHAHQVAKQCNDVIVSKKK